MFVLQGSCALLHVACGRDMVYRSANFMLPILMDALLGSLFVFKNPRKPIASDTSDTSSLACHHHHRHRRKSQFKILDVQKERPIIRLQIEKVKSSVDSSELLQQRQQENCRLKTKLERHDSARNHRRD